ncbi:3-hydroxyacyl-CoA dehydrogenase family protein [Amycolatopsis pithecellobii]|uniref:3-hydroxyacyl-CoA dehydrogenase family protein n=1 Tax=Amycolatopsis pithecellobii TaxID=664692 RepID=A0A6N7YLP9_9PSEU|nr:3-hydroxyacyl-CoA dehydrogenase family protein [Amycolatopsis pithecellobii]MTD53855.1 3-hydroxyacyl-CoA dehydrogenase family protein [Amycolatopsis pithecellobii]
MLTVAVLGTGRMGAGIAGVLAAHGHRVQLYDADPHTAAEAAGRLAATAHRDLEGTVADADVVIEAVAERLPVKQELFARVAASNRTALLATNTSVLPISDIARHVDVPGRVVGTHWWNPPDLMPLVEVVRGEQTTDETMRAAVDFLSSLGKTPVRVERDVPGFVGNRLQHALWREAIALVADGICDAETVDLVARTTIGLRLAAMGPLENADYVGLDLTLDIHEAVLPSLSRDPGPAPLLRRHVKAGRVGARSGHGFLRWPPGTRESAAARLAAHVRRQRDTIVSIKEETA